MIVVCHITILSSTCMYNYFVEILVSKFGIKYTWQNRKECICILVSLCLRLLSFELFSDAGLILEKKTRGFIYGREWVDLLWCLGCFSFYY